MANIVKLIITADNAGALRAIRSTAVASEEASKSIVASDEETAAANRETSASFDSMSKGVMMLGTVAFAALAFGMDRSVKAAMAWQTQQVALQQTMKNTGQFSAAALKGINAQTEALATHGGFSVASQLPAVTQLIGATHNLTEAQQLNVAATNLARGAHLDYATAVKDVEGAAIGQGRAIQKLIGVVVPVTKFTYGWTAAMKAADQAGYQHAQTLNKLATGQEILSRVQATYGNQTQAYSKTTAGALSNLSNAFEILLVKLGVGLLPTINTVAQALGSMGGWMTGHIGTVKEIAKQVGVFALVIGAVVVATKAWTIANRLLDESSPMLLAITAISLAIMEVITHLGWFKTAWGNVVNFVSGLAGTIAKAATGIWDGLKSGLVSVLNWIIGAINSVIGAIDSIKYPSFLGIGGGQVLHIGKIGLIGAQAHPAQGPQGQVGGAPNQSVTPGRHLAPNNAPQPIVLHHTTMLDGRVLAEETVHIQQKRTALS